MTSQKGISSFIDHKNCSVLLAESSSSLHAAFGSSSVWSRQSTQTYITRRTFSGSPSTTTPLASRTDMICCDKNVMTRTGPWKWKASEHRSSKNLIHFRSIKYEETLILTSSNRTICKTLPILNNKTHVYSCLKLMFLNLSWWHFLCD